MPDIFENVDGLKWSEKLVNGKYRVRVPAFNDVHSWWNDWETARFNSMEALLKPGMVLYDIGAFDGWQDAILSRFVGGGHNMVLIEPVAENWANIKATWDANGVEVPLATYMGFIGRRTELFSVTNPENRELMPIINPSVWPTGPDYSKVIAVTKFKLLAEHRHNTPSIALDDFAKCVPHPDALNIDVEGAELEVLQSASRVLEVYKPIVWLSIHREFMRDRYQTEPEEVQALMRSLGYTGTYLGTDHEEHFVYAK